MRERPRIVVDAQSGAGGPTEPVRAAALISRETSIRTILVGNPAELEGELAMVDHDKSRLEIHPATAPAQPSAPFAWARASLETAARLLSDGTADALVTRGSSAVLVEVASAYVERIPGIRSPALAAVYPTRERSLSNDRFGLLLDVGATVHCTAEELLFFGYMGSAYTQSVSKNPSPSIALLNMGADERAGDEGLRHAHRLLKNDARLNFIGNVSGTSLPQGIADVVVCEGLVGNIVAQMATGLSDVFQSLGAWAFKQRIGWRMGLRLMASGVQELKSLTDYREYGGAPFLGFRRMIIKAHSQSSAHAIANSIKVAAKAARDDVCGKIASAVTAFAAQRPEV